MLETEQLETKLKEQELLNEKMTQEFQGMKTRFLEAEAQVEQLELLMDTERKNRKRMEKDAIDLLKKVKNKYEVQVEVEKQKQQLNGNGHQTKGESLPTNEKDILLLKEKDILLLTEKERVLQMKKDLETEKEAKKELQVKFEGLKKKYEKLAEAEKQRLKQEQEVNRQSQVNRRDHETKEREKKELEDKYDHLLDRYDKMTTRFEREIEELKRQASETAVKKQRVTLESQNNHEKESDTKFERLLSRYDKMKTKYEKEIEELKEQALETVLKKQRIQTQILASITEKMETEKKKLTEEVEALKLSLSTTDESWKKEHQRNEVLKTTCSQIEIQADQFEKLFETKKEENLKLLQEKRDLQRTGAYLEAKIRELEDHLAREKSKNLELSQEAKSLRDKNVKLLPEKREAERKADSLDAKLRYLEEQLSREKAKSAELCNEIKTEREKTGKLSQEKRDALRRSDTFEANVRQLEEHLTREKNKTAELLHEMEMLRDHFENQLQLESGKVMALDREISAERQQAKEFCRQLGLAQQEETQKTRTVEDLKEEVEYLEQQLLAIKEEAATHITNVISMKMTNVTLSRALEDALTKCDRTEQRLEDTLCAMESSEARFEREKLKLQETVNQQTKLVNFLQGKYETLEHQKKVSGSPYSRSQSTAPTSRSSLSLSLQPFFGSPFCTASTSKGPVPASINSKETGAALARERETNRKLTQDLHKAQAELMDLKMEVKLIKCNVIDTESKDPSAPPPPYRVGEDSSSSLSSSLTTDNNDTDSNSGVSVAVDAVVYADVHHPNRSNVTRDYHPHEEFTFTDSVLEDLNNTKESK